MGDVMSEPRVDAVDRVRRFVRAYAAAKEGLDAERVSTFNDHALLLSDLRILVGDCREQLARDLARTPDPALKMRVAELVAVREQRLTSESDCDVWWELADLRWVLARRAESAESIPQGDGTDKGAGDG